MKVLFFDHPEADFLAALLYLGLSEELGPENVVDCPYKLSYHGQHHTYPSPYDHGSGTSPWHRWEKTDQGPVGHTSPFAWMRAQPGREWTKTEIIDRLGEFDLAVLASPRAWAVQALEEILSVARDRMPPLVMADGEDYEEIRWDLLLRFRPKVYFKRELVPEPRKIWVVEERRLRDAREDPAILPLPFASPILERAPVSKDIDVLFLGGETSAMRVEACAALRQKLGARFVGGAGVTFGYDAYLDALSRAKIAVSVRGHGMDTLRYWEIPSFDTLLLADRLPLIRPLPFVDGRDAVFFDGSGDLVEKALHHLERDEERERVARSGNSHLREHHTACARARYLLANAPRR